MWVHLTLQMSRSFGVIRCAFSELDGNSKAPNHRAKRTTIWASVVCAMHVGTFNLARVKVISGSFGTLVYVVLFLFSPLLKFFSLSPPDLSYGLPSFWVFVSICTSFSALFSACFLCSGTSCYRLNLGLTYISLSGINSIKPAHYSKDYSHNDASKRARKSDSETQLLRLQNS